MALLDSIGAFGSTIGALARQAANEAASRSLLNGSVPPPPEAPAETTPVTPPVDKDKAAAATPGKASVLVPPDLLPIYAAASERTGIPIEALIAQGKQESNFNADAVGRAGEIGLHQIKPSTAAAPGYGVKPIDPATLKDPAVNINFAADYMAARAGHPNFNDPAAVDAALRKYNSGGDPNYVANVRRYMVGS
jgi:soluble lytic murein transglycosylase-like protein